MSTTDYASMFKRQIEPLVLSGLVRIVEERSDPMQFGDTILVISGASIQMRLVADRGQLFADISSGTTPPRWLPLRSVLVHLGKAEQASEHVPWKTADEIGRYIRDNFATLESSFSSDDPGLQKIREVG